jgi:transcriptional regulator with XRE-family HTH domain
VPIRITFAQLCRTTRRRLGLTQQQLGEAVGISHGYIARIELGQADPSLGLVERIAAALDLDVELVSRAPIVIGEGRQRDLVHARCSGQVDRRLRSAGWLTARESEVVHARSHGWIDLLAFDPTTGTLLVIEIKTRLDDIGAVERQLGWYQRSAFEVAERLGWRPRRVLGWLLILASDEVEGVIRANQELLSRAFPVRARSMSALLANGDEPIGGHGLALVDPVRKRLAWLIPSRIDGRRSRAPYRDYADAARRLAA